MARMLTTERMQKIMADADLGRPAKSYTEQELAFRAEIELELAAAHERGERLDFTAELPDLA